MHKNFNSFLRFYVQNKIKAGQIPVNHTTFTKAKRLPLCLEHFEPFEDSSLRFGIQRTESAEKPDLLVGEVGGIQSALVVAEARCTRIRFVADQIERGNL